MKILLTQLIRTSVLSFMLVLISPTTRAQTVDAYLVSDFDSGNVQVFSVATNQLLSTIQAGVSPGTPALSADGRLAYVPNINSTYLSVLDLSIGAEIKRVHLIGDPAGNNVAALTPDGTRVLTDGAAGKLAIIDTTSFSITYVPLAPVCDQLAPVNCDTDPNDIHILAIAIAGNKAYLNLLTSSPVPIVCVDLNTLTVSTVPGSAVGLDLSVISIGVTPDSHFVIAKRNGPDTLLVIDTSTNTVVQRLALGITPRQLQVTTPGGASRSVFAYVIGSDSSGNVVVQAYQLNAGVLSLAGSVTLFPFTLSLRDGLSPDSTRLYLGSGPTLIVLDTQAIISNPPGAVINQFQIGNLIDGVAAAAVQLQPLATAPSVAEVAPNLVLNSDTAMGRTVQVTGTTFAPEALVRIGNLDPFAPTITGSSSLQATLPAGVAAQAANIIVTNPNSGSPVANRQQSGILRGQLTITSPPTFEPVNQAIVANGGNSTTAVLNVSTNAGVLPSISGTLGAVGVAITPDGERAYIGQFFPAGVSVINLVQNQLENTISLSPIQPLGQIDGLVVSPSPVFGGSVVYTTAPFSLPNGNEDQQLFVIDANPANTSTFNQVRTTELAGQSLLGFPESGAIATTPDGRYVYTSMFIPLSSAGWLIVFDVVSGFANTIPASELNVAGFQGHIEVSPDGKTLLLAGLDNNIHVFDISSDPLTPSPLALVVAQAPPGFLPLNLSTFRIPANAANILFAFDPVQNVVAEFNFNRTAGDFSQLGAVAIPGLAGIAGSTGLDVTSDGKLVYALLSVEDDVAALDGAKVAKSDPTAVLTKILTGLGPETIAMRPGTPTPLTTPGAPTVTVIPTQGITISFSDVSSAGATTVTTTNTTPFSAPAGFQLSGVPVYYELASSATFSAAVVCFQYDPAKLPNPESSLRLAHYNNSIDPITNQVIGWEDVTIPGSPDTTTHTICGQVSSFSPFVIGIASIDFLFNSLLADISMLSPAVTPAGVMRSFRAKALAARASADKGKNTSAQNQLNALINQLQALSGKQLSPSDANTLINEANTILSHL